MDGSDHASLPKRHVHPLIKTWVILHAIIISCWSIPITPKSLQAYTRKNATPREIANSPRPKFLQWVQIYNDQLVRENSLVRNYLLPTGFWQYWDMFAPDPSNNDIWFDATIATNDNKTVNMELNRIASMPLVKKYFKERYRKYFERVHLDQNQWCWPYVAQAVARDFQATSGEKPTTIKLRRHFRFVTYGKPIPPYTEFTFFTYAVKPEDLN